MQTSEAKGEAKGAADRASSAASDAADATRRAAGQAADTVRGAAQDAKGAVKGAAQDAKGAVKGAADRAADKARGAGAAAKDVAQDAAAAAQDKADKGFFMWKVSSHPGPAQGLPENHGRQALKTHINLGTAHAQLLPGRRAQQPAHTVRGVGSARWIQQQLLLQPKHEPPSVTHPVRLCRAPPAA